MDNKTKIADTGYFRILKELTNINNDYQNNESTLLYNGESFDYNDVISSDLVEKGLYIKTATILLHKFEHNSLKGKPMSNSYRPIIFSDTKFLEDKYEQQDYVNPKNLLRDTAQTLTNNLNKYHRTLESVLNG